MRKDKIAVLALVLMSAMSVSCSRIGAPGDDAITTDRLKSVPVRALENSWNLTKNVDAREEIRDLPKLERDGRTPEEFGQLVAEHYKAWAAIVPHPVAAMAADAGVKAPTVHGWVREARLRGFLPPAQRGKG